MKHLFQAIHEASKDSVQNLSIAQEADVEDGKTFKEHEHEFYVEIEDFEQLKSAESVDLQEQWNLKIDKTAGNIAKGALRIRQIYQGDLQGGPNQKPQGEAQYVLTTKVNQGIGKRLEVPTPTTVDGFNLFAMLSDSGMIKHRYHFPVGDLVFEVDMFLNPEGGYFPVAKIDLEVKNLSGEIPELPIKVKSIIKGDTKDSSEKAKITEYYDKYFITKNKFISKDAVAQEGIIGDLIGAVGKMFKAKTLTFDKKQQNAVFVRYDQLSEQIEATYGDLKKVGRFKLHTGEISPANIAGWLADKDTITVGDLGRIIKADLAAIKTFTEASYRAASVNAAGIDKILAAAVKGGLTKEKYDKLNQDLRTHSAKFKMPALPSGGNFANIAFVSEKTKTPYNPNARMEDTMYGQNGKYKLVLSEVGKKKMVGKPLQALTAEQIVEVAQAMRAICHALRSEIPRFYDQDVYLTDGEDEAGFEIDEFTGSTGGTYYYQITKSSFEFDYLPVEMAVNYTEFLYYILKALNRWISASIVGAEKEDTPAQESISGLQRIQARRQGTVAQEGFFDFLFGGKKKTATPNKTPTKEESLWVWGDRNLKGEKLNSIYKLTGKDVRVDKHIAAMLYLGDQKLTSVSELIAEAQNSLDYYTKVFTSVAPKLEKICKIQDSLVTEADDFLTGDSGKLTWENLRALLMKYKGKLPAPLAKEFGNVKMKLLGDFATPLVENDKDVKGGRAFPFGTELSSVGGVTLTAPSQTELDNLVKLGAKVRKQCKDIENWSSLHLTIGIDQSDPPWRGMDELNTDEEARDVLDDFSHEPFELMYTNIVELLLDRLGYVLEIIWEVIRTAVRENDTSDHEYR